MSNRRPPPLIIDILLDASEISNDQSLVITDDQGRRWDVMDAMLASGNGKDKRTQIQRSEIILERWTINLGNRTSAIPSPADLNSVLPAVYKKSIVLFRSLYTYSHFLPAWKFSRRAAVARTSSQLKLRYRIKEGNSAQTSPQPNGLTIPLCDSSENVTNDYSFGVTDSPAGPFSVNVRYRNNCDFQVDDAEALLSSRLLGTDEELFKPSLPREDSVRRLHDREGAEVGSVPVQKKELYDRADRSQAYGSLSTFHQVGPATSSSPISALRNAQELGPLSPRTSPTIRQSPTQRSSPTYRPSLKRDDTSGTGRRPSINFQPFKAPPLSASPSSNLQNRPSQNRVSALSALKEARGMPSPAVSASASKSLPKAPEPSGGGSPASSSPKPTPVTRYSSSFSHRRARLSVGGAVNRNDEEQGSSGKGSAASSSRKGSGQGPEKGVATSASANDDDENISNFLKMLETERDLLTPSDSAAVEASNRRTAAQLNRFHRIRDSTNALSDSMSSSLVLHRSSSSSSRQLSSVPPMVAATSVSTSSSPGKPISPHTPHTPAIPSRLSANSIIDYSQRSTSSPHHLSQNVPASPSEETASEATATNHPPSNNSTFGIPIPMSPRPYIPSYRRSSSVAQRRAAAEEDVGDFCGLRSASAGAEDRSQALTLSALLGQHDERESTSQPAANPERTDTSPNQPPIISDRRSSLEFRKYPLLAHQGDGANSGSASGGASGGSSTQLPYRTRYRAGVGRGSSRHSSSSSLIAGQERGDNGSGQMERRGGRFSFGRESRPDTKFDEEEPLLFAMSDFGASRRSLEEARGGSEAVSNTSARRGPRRGRGGSGSTGMPGGFPETWD